MENSAGLLAHVTRVVVRSAGAAVFALAVAMSPDATAGHISTTFSCGSTVCGNLDIDYRDQLLFNGAGQLVAGDNSSWAGRFGMMLVARATPTGHVKRLAWMQAVVQDDLNSAVHRADRNNNPVTAPYEDSPPGGTKVIMPGVPPDPIGSPADAEPWYYNNKISDLELSDGPVGLTDLVIGFESWLVCVVSTGSDPSSGPFEVIPLIGFTWGFDASKGEDGPDPGNVAGDLRTEYLTSLHVDAPIQGGQPSDAFKQGYAKYHAITYLANDDASCARCMPEPSTMSALVVAAIAGFRFRRNRPH